MSGLDARARRRHVRTFAIAWHLAGPVIRRLLRWEGEPIPQVEGPVFLVSNHNTDLDCVLLGLASRRQIYFVATETVARMGLLGKFLMRYFDPILHNKGTVGAGTSRAILSRIRAGYGVALFPEGNRSFNGLTCPIPPATGKLIRLSGATLVTYRLTGGYFTTPRWGRGLRRGRIRGRVMGVYPPEQLRAMAPEEVQAAVERDLQTDAYAEQREEPVAFRSRHGAEYLESTLFLCPHCGKIGTLQSAGDRLSCRDCGRTLIYTPTGMPRAPDGAETTITALDLAQRQRLEALAEAAGRDALFSDPVHVRRVENGQSTEESEAVLSAGAGGFAAGDRQFSLDEISALSIVQRSRLLLYPAAESAHYEFTGAPGFNALKYLYLFRHYRPSANGVL